MIHSIAMNIEIFSLVADFQKRLFHLCVASADIAVNREFAHIFVFPLKITSCTIPFWMFS